MGMSCVPVGEAPIRKSDVIGLSLAPDKAAQSHDRTLFCRKNWGAAATEIQFQDCPVVEIFERSVVHLHTVYPHPPRDSVCFPTISTEIRQCTQPATATNQLVTQPEKLNGTRSLIGAACRAVRRVVAVIRFSAFVSRRPKEITQFSFPFQIFQVHTTSICAIGIQIFGSPTNPEAQWSHRNTYPLVTECVAKP